MLPDISVRIFRVPLTLFSLTSAIERTLLKAAEQTKKVDRVDHDPLDSATSFLFPLDIFTPFFPAGPRRFPGFTTLHGPFDHSPMSPLRPGLLSYCFNISTHTWRFFFYVSIFWRDNTLGSTI